MRRYPTRKELATLLHYDAETGVFTWKVNKSRTAKIGTVAGRRDTYGYIQIGINGLRCFAHRLAWCYVYGNCPRFRLDHINSVPSDNRIRNLRRATLRQNVHAAKRRKDNKSGYIGVQKIRNKWVVQAGKNKLKIYIGQFDSKIEAARAYDARVFKMRGKFARLNFPQEYAL